MEVTVAALQTALTDDVAGNVARVTELCREAAGRGAQILLPSELFEGPYFCRTSARPTSPVRSPPRVTRRCATSSGSPPSSAR